MRLQEIQLTQFRNFTNSRFTFEQNVVGITGLNGIGKTNLLDAIYYLCYTKSYFQSRDKSNVQHQQNGFRIAGTFNDIDKHTEIACVWKDGKKQIYNNKQPYDKISDHIGKYAAVMIAPDDNELLLGGGENRRKFFDGILSIKDAEYFQNLLLYNKILQQKNAYLKMLVGYQPDYALLDIYNQQLATSGAYMIAHRALLTNEISPLLSHYYSAISSNTSEECSVLYSKYSNENELFRLYELNIKFELEAKRTLFGPHLDDWGFFINESNCKLHASQGQKKNYLIALKLSQIAVLAKVHIQPILLLDDIFEKLDPVRLYNLFMLLKGMDFAQIFMTHTQSQDIRNTISSIFDNVQLLEL